jgi:hypothetical protein
MSKLVSTKMKKETIMVIILLALLILILFGAGFAVHLLWIAAVVVAIAWVVGFVLSRGEAADRRSLRR